MARTHAGQLDKIKMHLICGGSEVKVKVSKYFDENLMMNLLYLLSIHDMIYFMVYLYIFAI